MTLSNANGAIILDSSCEIGIDNNWLLFPFVFVIKIIASSPVISETIIV